MGGRVTRKPAAKRLGISQTKLRRLEAAGAIPFETDERGVHWFATTDLDAHLAARAASPPTETTTTATGSPHRSLAASDPTGLATRPTTPGDIAAAVFADLDEGLHPVAIVQQRAIAPDVVRRLTDEWRRMRNADGATLYATTARDEIETLAARVASLETLLAGMLGPMPCYQCRGVAPPLRMVACRFCATPAVVGP
ncbi:MAG: hypothetical protein IT379_29995 [Deltaproteobacteria bacterium]|nr:hypothetical protein [Deltaproteobacteria bacterium]